MTILLLLLVLVTVGCQNPDLCPFQCTCEDRSVVCKGLDRFPNGLPDEIEELIFDVCEFGDDFKQNELQTFKNLKSLIFMNSKFTAIHSCTFADLSNITKLLFDKVEIGDVVTNGFSHLSRVKEFTMSRSIIRKFHRYAFNDIQLVDTFTLSGLVIIDMDNFAFHNFSNIRFMQLRNIQVFRLNSSPLAELNSIDKLEIHGGTFPSSFCGMAKVMRNKTVKKIKFERNKLMCSCNATWIAEIRAERPQNFEPLNNTCLAPNSFAGQDILAIETSKLCRTDEIPSCGHGLYRTRVPTCQMLTLDEPILPGDTVPYPNTDSPNGSANQHTVSVNVFVMYLLLVPWTSKMIC